MWRTIFAMMSVVMLAVTSTASALADSHEAAGTTAAGAATTGATAAAPVTAVPRAGVGLMADPAQDMLLLGLVGIAGLFVLLAVSTMWQRQRS